MGARIGGNELSGGEHRWPWSPSRSRRLGMEMDEDILPFKGALQKDFLVIFRKEGVQVELLVGEPIGFQG